MSFSIKRYNIHVPVIKNNSHVDDRVAIIMVKMRKQRPARWVHIVVGVVHKICRNLDAVVFDAQLHDCYRY